MSERRVVEYLVVAGIVERNNSEAAITSKPAIELRLRCCISKINFDLFLCLS